MGTRHLIGVVLDGDFKIAQYGQWDGYPGGQGVDVLAFLRTANIEDFKRKVREIRFMTDADKAQMDADLEALGCKDGWMTMDQSANFFSRPEYAPLSRDVGAQVLRMVADGYVQFLRDDREFALDGLFCEWAYVIDLDHEVLEAYHGFQKLPPKRGRWAGEPAAENGYAPVAMLAEWPVGDLPADEDFLTALLGEEAD